jgi:hypothetical protein
VSGNVPDRFDFVLATSGTASGILAHLPAHFPSSTHLIRETIGPVLQAAFCLEGASMSLSRLRARALLPASVLLLAGVTTHAANHASRVISYAPGTADPSFTTPSAVLGPASPLTGENPAASNYFGFPNILSPFSPAYQGDEIVQIGEGGHLVVELSRFALVGAGREIGIFSNAGLIDTSYPNGQNTIPATWFGGGSANISVSADNITWVPLGSRDFKTPTVYFSNAGPYDTAPPPSPQTSDFGAPFPGPFSCFDGADWTKTRNCFFDSPTAGYSAGGDWLDLSSSGLSRVAYIRFDIPSDGDPLTNHRLAIDTIAINNAATGASVPEPTSLALLTIALLSLRRRR